MLAEVAGVFGANGVSIRSMEQQGEADQAKILFITHQAREADMTSTLEKLASLPSVNRVGEPFRVVSD